MGLGALEALLDTAPKLTDLAVSVEKPLGGFARSFQCEDTSYFMRFSLDFVHICGVWPRFDRTSWQDAIPPPFLSTVMALSCLQSLTFDFLADDLLLHLPHDHGWQLRSVRLSGCRSCLEPECLVTLLGKLSLDLEDFALQLDTQLELRSFTEGFMHERLGSMPELWRNRLALRRLELTLGATYFYHVLSIFLSIFIYFHQFSMVLYRNWYAFDDDGMATMLECCPQLEVLLMDRAERLGDATSMTFGQSIPNIQHVN